MDFPFGSVPSKKFAATLTNTMSLEQIKMRGIMTRIRIRLGRRIREAFAFVVVTAWADLANDVFRMATGDSTHILMQLFHAILLTLLAVAVTIMFESDEENDGD
jgi:hypothetical protein